MTVKKASVARRVFTPLQGFYYMGEVFDSYPGVNFRVKVFEIFPPHFNIASGGDDFFFRKSAFFL